jgi:transposase-like protein
MQNPTQPHALRRLRASLRLVPPGPRRRFPPELRAELAVYARERLAQGVSQARVASELGVSAPTVARLGGRAAPRALVPVRVVEDDAPPRVAITVRGPCGLVIEGLDVAGVAALLREVSE